MCWPRRYNVLDFCTATKLGSRCLQQPRTSCASGFLVVFRNQFACEVKGMIVANEKLGDKLVLSESCVKLRAPGLL